MSNLILILLISSILYYVSFVVITFSEFKKSKVVIPFTVAFCIPLYILNEVRKISYLENKSPFSFFKRIPLYNIYLVIFAEVVYFNIDSDTLVGMKHKLKYKSIFNQKVKTKFTKLLCDYLRNM